MVMLGGTTWSALLEERSCVVVRGRAILAPQKTPTAAPRARASHRLLLLSMLLLSLPCRRRPRSHPLVPYSYSSSHVSPSVQSQPMIVVGEIEPLRRAAQGVLLVLVLLVRVHEAGVLEERTVLLLLLLLLRRRRRRWRLPWRTTGGAVVARLAR